MNAKESKKIAIIGSGVVGQASGKGLKNIGHMVTFYDVAPKIIQSLKEVGHDADHIMSLNVRSDEYSAYMISIHTPTVYGKANLDPLRSALADVGRKIRSVSNFPVVVLRSTMPPGTTENIAIPILEKFSEKKCDKDFGICMNPEFLREATSEKDFAQPWITVIGSNEKSSGMILEEIYKAFESPIIHMSLAEAEMMKYSHNLFNATKISFFNEMRLACKKIGVDPDIVFQSTIKSAEGIWNPEYGIRDFGPFGGACLPKDTQAFYAWSKDFLNLEMPVLRGTIETNIMIKALNKKSMQEKMQEKAVA